MFKFDILKIAISTFLHSNMASEDEDLKKELVPGGLEAKVLVVEKSGERRVEVRRFPAKGTTIASNSLQPSWDQAIMDRVWIPRDGWATASVWGGEIQKPMTMSKITC